MHCFSATDDFYDLRDQADDLNRQLQNEGNAREAVEREVQQVLTSSHTLLSPTSSHLLLPQTDTDLLRCCGRFPACTLADQSVVAAPL